MCWACSGAYVTSFWSYQGHWFSQKGSAQYGPRHTYLKRSLKIAPWRWVITEVKTSNQPNIPSYYHKGKKWNKCQEKQGRKLKTVDRRKLGRRRETEVISWKMNNLLKSSSLVWIAKCELNPWRIQEELCIFLEGWMEGALWRMRWDRRSGIQPYGGVWQRGTPLVQGP